MADARQVAAYEEALYTIAAATVRTRKATSGFTVRPDAAGELLVACEDALTSLIALRAVPTLPRGTGIAPPTPDPDRLYKARPRLTDGAKPDEVALWLMIQDGTSPRQVGPLLGMPRKRLLYLCEKWARRGIYNYGVAADVGWVQ